MSNLHEKGPMRIKLRFIKDLLSEQSVSSLSAKINSVQCQVYDPVKSNLVLINCHNLLSSSLYVFGVRL